MRRIKYIALFVLVVAIGISNTFILKIIAKEELVKPIRSVATKQQFCKLHYEQLREQTISFDYCYKYPAALVNIGMDWYWGESSRLNQFIDNAHVTNKQTNLVEKKTPTEQGVHTDPTEQTSKPAEGIPTVYITFDDGPGKYTDQVLDILKQENISATFFILGIQAEKNPLFTKRIVDEGHAIGNHTYDHDYKKIYNSFETFADQVFKTNKIIYELTGVETTLFRAPGGSINNMDEGYFKAMHEAGFTIFDWNIDSKDSQIKGIKKDDITQQIKESVLFDPAIVLLHDTNSHEQSLLALPDIIAYFKEQGYQFASITKETEEHAFRLGKNLKWSRASVTEQQIEAFKLKMAQLYK